MRPLYRAAYHSAVRMFRVFARRVEMRASTVPPSPAARPRGGDLRKTKLHPRSFFKRRLNGVERPSFKKLVPSSMAFGPAHMADYPDECAFRPVDSSTDR